MYITDYKKNTTTMRNQLFQQQQKKQNVKCRTGNCGNVNLRFLTVNYTISLSKTVHLTVFYSKIISQLFTV